LTAGCAQEEGPTPPGPPQTPAGPVTPAPAPPTPKPPEPATDLSWPAGRERCLFAFETHGNPVIAFGEGGRLLAGYGVFGEQLDARDLAIVDPLGRLVVRGGSFHAKQVGPYLLKALSQANALTVEAVVGPEGLTGRLPEDILAFGTGPRTRNFGLVQDGVELVFHLRTSATDDRPGGRDVTLLKLTAARPVHVVVTYAAGRLACYRNGERVMETGVFGGTFASWRQGEFVLGDEIGKRRNWNGTLEYVAVYARALPAEEVRLNADAWLAHAEKRRQPRRVELSARLVARSATPVHRQIAPQEQGLADYLYDVETVYRGQCESRRIVVAHWTMLDKRRLPFADAPPGTSYELELIRLRDHPHLASVPRFDDLAEQVGDEVFDLPIYYDAGGLSLDWEP
jgi:hypothetical protein